MDGRGSSRTSAERALAQLARRQHGVFTRAQAIAIGVPSSTVDGRVGIGRYLVLRPGVHIEAAAPASWEARALAAVLWAGGDAVLARQSAARLHDLPVPRSERDGLHLLTSTRCFDAPPGVVVHRTRRLGDHHHTRVAGIPVTTVARTVCDLATPFGPVALRAAVSAAVRAEMLDATSLRTQLAELGRVRGAVALRLLADELSPLDAQCRSALEHLYLRTARAHGLEPTAMNHPVRDRRGRRRYLDAVHLPQRLPVEVDSAYFHGNRLDTNDDRAREHDLEVGVAWHIPVRVTQDELHHQPGAAMARVQQALDEIASGARPPLTNPAPFTTVG